jgi:uncharacterized membrane protein
MITTAQSQPAGRTPLTTGARIVAGAFAVSGAVHLVRPEVFTPIVPRRLPAPRLLVLVSGVAELACAVGMLVPWSRRPAGAAAAVLLVAVFPANVQMALDAHHAAVEQPTSQHRIRRLVSLARLPLQIPLIRWAWSATRP